MPESTTVVADLDKTARAVVGDKNMQEAEGLVLKVKISEHGNSAPPFSPLLVGELKLM